ncbi:MAG TPA: SDR family oxidoreductase [Gemmatimonadaceae bacterium]|jgi:dehydrogenase/reductase SDR family protein 13
MTPDTDLRGRTFLVTGANSGLGRATAQALTARGGSVVLAARSEERTRPVLEALRTQYPNAELDFLRVDLGSLASVRRAAEQFLSTGKPLDVLINNAGLAGAVGLTTDGFEITIGTNYVGPFYLTQLLLPRLRQAPQGRVVNVASVAHTSVKRFDWTWLDRGREPSRSGFAQYAESKLLNILNARELAQRLDGTRVTTYALHPGAVASNIWRALPWPVRTLMKLFMLSNENGAKTQVWCATAPELASQTGRYYVKCREARPTALARDDVLAAELYTRTEAAIAAAITG